MENRPSEVYAFQPDYTWNGVEVRRYKPQEGGWEGISRQVITGWGHETRFQVRYFEISESGYSSLEKHGHAHVVMCLRGSGEVVVGEERVTLRLHDVLYLKPWEPHQFVNHGHEPFGFLCVVDGERDRPQPVSGVELKRIQEGSAGSIVKVDAPVLQPAQE